MQELEAFIGWLRSQGTPEPHLAVYRHFVAELAKHPSLSAALRAAEEAGTPAQQVANLRQTAARLVEFEAAAGGSPTVEPRQARSTGAAGLELEHRQPRSTDSPHLRDVTHGRAGCICSRRYDVYLDNDFGALAGMLGGGIGIGTIILIRLVGILGALAMALGLAGMGGLVTILSICLRCQGCRRRVTDLDQDEREHVRKGRALVALVTFGLLAGAAVCGFLWLRMVKAAPVHY